MHTASVTYDLIYQFRDYPEYQVTLCGKVFNTKTGRQIKKVMNCRSVGFWVKGKFFTIKKARKQLIKIPKEPCPF